MKQILNINPRDVSLSSGIININYNALILLIFVFWEKNSPEIHKKSTSSVFIKATMQARQKQNEHFFSYFLSFNKKKKLSDISENTLFYNAHAHHCHTCRHGYVGN